MLYAYLRYRISAKKEKTKAAYTVASLKGLAHLGASENDENKTKKLTF